MQSIDFYNQSVDLNSATSNEVLVPSIEGIPTVIPSKASTEQSVVINFNPESTGEYNALVDVTIDVHLPKEFVHLIGVPAEIEIMLVIDFGETAYPRPTGQGVVVDVDFSKYLENSIVLMSPHQYYNGVFRSLSRVVGKFVGRYTSFRIGLHWTCIWAHGSNQFLYTDLFLMVTALTTQTAIRWVPPVGSSDTGVPLNYPYDCPDCCTLGLEELFAEQDLAVTSGAEPGVDLPDFEMV